jgi:hypothetical protein
MSLTLPAEPQGPPGLDFEGLRSAGIARLQALAGTVWTDYNTTDPGVTLLEVLCYAITDLTYRAGHSVPDLLAETADPGSLPTASEVLSCAPVSPEDLRRIVLDVEGVRNAWVSLISLPDPEIHFAAGARQVGFRPDPPVTEPVRIAGLYDVSIEKADTTALSADAVRSAVARRLLAGRSVGEDFETIRVLPPQPVTVLATLEVDVLDRPADVLLEVYDVVAEYFSPTLGFRSLAEMLADDIPVEEIFEGPPLTNGFLRADDLAANARRQTARSSDLIAAISTVPGVRTVQAFAMSAGGKADPWALGLDPDRAPRLDLAGSVVRLVRGRSQVVLDGAALQAVRDGVTVRRADRERAARSGGSTGGLDLPVPRGRSRNVASFPSVRHDLPRAYAVADEGLDAAALPRRRAAARQLQAYLVLFDQVLAGMAAQLASVGDLLSPAAGDPGTYATPLPPEAGIAAVLTSPVDYATSIDRITAATAGDAPGERRNRFLSHLLARQGEDLPDYGSDPLGAARDKARLLPQLPLLSARRGTGIDYLQAATQAAGTASGPTASGLVERIAAKVGLLASDGEEILLIEHVLLRPTERDVSVDGPPLLEAVDGDPYSLQVTFVLPTTPPRFAPGAFRDHLLAVLRAETPAHLRMTMAWADPETFIQLRDAYGQLLAGRARIWSDLDVADSPASPASPA